MNTHNKIEHKQRSSLTTQREARASTDESQIQSLDERITVFFEELIPQTSSPSATNEKTSNGFTLYDGIQDERKTYKVQRPVIGYDAPFASRQDQAPGRIINLRDPVGEMMLDHIDVAPMEVTDISPEIVPNAADEFGNIFLDDSLPDLTQVGNVVENQAGTSQEFVANPQKDNLISELYKEPLDIYRDFTQALYDIALTLYEKAPDDDTADGAKDDVNAHGEIHVSDTLLTVAERLANLGEEEKLSIAQTIYDIVGTVHGLQILEAHHTDDELLVRLEEKLEGLYQKLLTELGIDDRNKQFIEVLLQPEFIRQLTSSQGEIDLEHEGTREVKRPIALINGQYAKDDSWFNQLLGMIALIYIRRSNTRQLPLQKAS